MRNLIICFVISAVVLSCSKSHTIPPVNKSWIPGHEWFTQGSTIRLKFNTDGTFYDQGTWKWLNNSDTIEIYYYADHHYDHWIIESNDEHELRGKQPGSINPIRFRNSQW